MGMTVELMDFYAVLITTAIATLLILYAEIGWDYISLCGKMSIVLTLMRHIN